MNLCVSEREGRKEKPVKGLCTPTLIIEARASLHAHDTPSPRAQAMRKELRSLTMLNNLQHTIYYILCFIYRPSERHCKTSTT